MTANGVVSIGPSSKRFCCFEKSSNRPTAPVLSWRSKSRIVDERRSLCPIPQMCVGLCMCMWQVATVWPLFDRTSGRRSVESMTKIRACEATDPVESVRCLALTSLEPASAPINDLGSPKSRWLESCCLRACLAAFGTLTCVLWVVGSPWLWHPCRRHTVRTLHIFESAKMAMSSVYTLRMVVSLGHSNTRVSRLGQPNA